MLLKIHMTILFLFRQKNRFILFFANLFEMPYSIRGRDHRKKFKRKQNQEKAKQSWSEREKIILGC